MGSKLSLYSTKNQKRYELSKNLFNIEADNNRAKQLQLFGIAFAIFSAAC